MPDLAVRVVMHYSKAFLDLQISFAERVRDLSGMPLERALFEYTNLYTRFGLGRSFDPFHPGWQTYLAGLGEDVREWICRFYLREPEAHTAPPVDATAGCFSYARFDDHLRLHFRNTDDRAPLSVGRVDRRRAELAALFASVEDLPVVGRSWLYNLEAYPRLFPKAYVSSARVVRGRFRSMPLWGQFVDRHGEVKESMMRPFRAALARQSSLDRLDACFPFPVMEVRAPAGAF